jgi:integrase/recombinase XerC
VLTVFGWAPEILDEWFTEIRPLFGIHGNPAAWPSERGPRVGCQRLDSRFIAYRQALDLDSGLDFHSLRRSYVTHLIEDGWDPRFVQVLLSPQERVHDVQHEAGACGNLRAGGGYLRSSVTQIPRRFDACSAGADARLVA